MTRKPQLKPEHLSKAFRERLDPVLTEPLPDTWLEPLVRELYGRPEEEQEQKSIINFFFPELVMWGGGALAQGIQSISDRFLFLG